MKRKSRTEAEKPKSTGSFSARIARMTVAVFFCIGVFSVLVFGVLRLRGVRRELERAGEAFLEEFFEAFSGEVSENAAFADRGGTLCIRSADTGREVYRVGSPKELFFIGNWALTKDDGERVLYGRYRTTVVLYDALCEAEFVFDCREDGKELARQSAWFFLWYLAAAALGTAAVYLIAKTTLVSASKLSDRVNKMTLQNIHSNRLDPDATEEELQELAVGINRMLDRMEEAYESQKQFVSEASHELRTPITVLQGYSAMLRRWGAKDSEVLAESVEAIESEAKSMQDLVDKLLFLSRHERKKLPFAKVRFDMAEVVRELEKEFSYMTEERVFECPVCESVSVYGDRQMLKQALRVFVDNAVKYTGKGDRISVFCRNKSGACEIVVEDTGIGMKKEELEGIFTRFFRADTVRGKNIDGHGLGLSIARLIVDGHAGKITIRTQYTKGSSFCVMLPRQRGG